MYKHAINVCHLNVFHLYKKVQDINVMLSSVANKVHVLGLSETRLDDRIEDYHISINNYTIIRRDKRSDKQTGFAAYVHDSICQQIKIRKDLQYKEIEDLWLEIKQDKAIPFLICYIYRNPAATTN